MEKCIRGIKRITLFILAVVMLTGLATGAFAHANEEEGTRTERVSSGNSDQERDTEASGENGGTGSTKKEAEGTTLADQDGTGADGSTEAKEKAEEGAEGSDKTGGEKIDRSKAFTSPGSAQVKDDIKDSSSKEFLTIVTKNNQTFYLVIDKSTTTDNVYLLSNVDEDDLKEFLGETAGNTQDQTPAVLLPEFTREAEATTAFEKKEDTEKEKKTKKGFPGGGNGFMIFILLASIAALAGGFYFKIYKPRTEEEDDFENEGLEDEQGYEEEEE